VEQAVQLLLVVVLRLLQVQAQPTVAAAVAVLDQQAAQVMWVVKVDLAL
jgi:hypothetical protein